MTKQISVPDGVYADLKNLTNGNKDSLTKVIIGLTEEANRKAKKEAILREFHKFKNNLSPIIDKEAWGIIEIMKFFLLKAIDEKDSKDKIRKIYEEIIPILNQGEGLIEEREISSFPFNIPRNCDSGDLTIKERLAYFLRYDESAPKGWFTSSQVRRIYEEVYGEEVRLSTISTYLASLHSGGVLERKGSRAMRQYRLFPMESMEGMKVASAVDVG